MNPKYIGLTKYLILFSFLVVNIFAQAQIISYVHMARQPLDEAMAENVSWLLENRYPNNKIVLWAHDVHISQCDHSNEHFNLNNSISMGSFLSRKYGNTYKVFSLSTYEGDYLTLKSYTDYARVHPLLPQNI